MGLLQNHRFAIKLKRAWIKNNPMVTLAVILMVLKVGTISKDLVARFSY